MAQAGLQPCRAAALLFRLWAWYTTFIDNPVTDAQDGLVFVVVPVYAAGGAILLVLLLRLIDRWRAGGSAR